MRAYTVVLAALLAVGSCSNARHAGTGEPVSTAGTNGPASSAVPATSGPTSIHLSSPISGGCAFDGRRLAFSGTSSQQASCLLRKIKAKGAGATAQPVPAWLTRNAGLRVSVSPAQFDRYLQRQGVPGGELPSSATGAGQVRYFVIHDTSSPERSQAQGFAADMDEPGYSGNNLASWDGDIRRRVNLIIGRDGRSKSFQAWGAMRNLPATKLEAAQRFPHARPIFVHVENVQPRLKPPGSWAWMAPVPGFSPQQEERLALAYISASIAAGRWLIPAYHFNIDEGFPDGHDDPQNVELRNWVAQVAALEEEMRR